MVIEILIFGTVPLEELNDHQCPNHRVSALNTLSAHHEHNVYSPAIWGLSYLSYDTLSQRESYISPISQWDDVVFCQPIMRNTRDLHHVLSLKHVCRSVGPVQSVLMSLVYKLWRV